MTKEIWKDIVGFEGYYQVSNFGNVKSLERKCKALGNKLRTVPSKAKAVTIDRYGYPKVSLDKDGHSYYFTIHRLVAQTFIPNPENKPQVNHIDGNKQNNCVENLEWCTAKENTDHSWKMGLQKIKHGSQRAWAKMNEEKVKEARKTYSLGGVSLKELAKKYNICSQALHNIILRKTWKHVE